MLNVVQAYMQAYGPEEIHSYASQASVNITTTPRTVGMFGSFTAPLGRDAWCDYWK